MKDSILATPYAEGFDDNFEQKISDIFNQALIKYGSCAVLIKGLDSVGAVAILNCCKCCERHQNKPPKFELWTENDFFNDTNVKHGLEQAKQLEICSCDCRHLTRWLCRGISVEELCMNCD